ncbi:hypothetical protein C8R45DRAFT_992188 [Mycena sanguinolenta]|nr:hypothetical protein C8R45DRAFT_992188 [Mycena sanguinolenta]
METYVLGGWDLAICAALFSQGVLCAQFARYVAQRKRDSESLLTKLFVGGLALLTTIKTVQALTMLWLQNVIMFDDSTIMSDLSQHHWVFLTTVIASAVIAFYVQIFFCYRLWVISRNVYLVAATFALLCLGLALACVATAITFLDLTKSVNWIAAHLGVAMCGDFLLTAGTVFSLLHHSKLAIPRGQTAQVLNALLRLTIQSAAPGAACALINFVTAVKWNHTTSDYPALMLSEISNMLLPNLYSISAMWTLNRRAVIRGILETDPTLHTLNVAAVKTDTSRDV